ncbi:baseplate multidomain protein megatron [Litoreibacter roseus]|uniref:Phage host specificity protein n=1 Tax=Litoreibacter roseus TaxID=2601869 RepID=A0A6N6JMN2_9RHOB|nr:glycoside hydrolase/phage tail family protein [Litoreibacter roseus]GFE66699.1 phage host specificity protein [Litoreibacter roseus]
MATILLSAAGGAAGGALGGGLLGISSAVIGRAVGATIGRVIDARLMGAGSETVEVGRTDRLRLMGASEGGGVPRVYGRMRTAGNVIWSSQYTEEVIVTESSGGKGAPKGPSTKEYKYKINLAVAVADGEITRVGRIWADGSLVSQRGLNMRVYKGKQDQLPDPVISAIEGSSNVPAYRGLSYVVFEDLELGPFGNRVPQFAFEVVRPAVADNVSQAPAMSDAVRGVALMPGTGEYALATKPVYKTNKYGNDVVMNVNSASGKTDFASSLEALNGELPNCKATSLVVSWFGDDLRAGSCRVLPKVENGPRDSKTLGSAYIGSASMTWEVAGIRRNQAEVVKRVDGRPVYGGTPTDASVVQAIQALKVAGQDVMFYPFILMEILEGNTLTNPWNGAPTQPPLPWRGRITSASEDKTEAAAEEVAAFMGTAEPRHFKIVGSTVRYSGPNEWSYRRFILHYAHLCKAAGGVKAFCVGSEMRAFTQIRDATGEFPAVNALRLLAREVKDILGSGTKIGYAADWSEYFGYRPDDGSGDVRFHLDSLWADDAIDYVGIDNYMPISDWRDDPDHLDADAGTLYDLDYLSGNIAGGEGYDWFYPDEASRKEQIRVPIEDGAHGEPWVYRYKDLKSWWSQPHHDRIDGVRQATPSPWIPQSKPIWFTELGCAAIDKGTNQPNKFLDPKSSESALPYFSTGARDDYIQGQYIRAYTYHFNQLENNPVSDVYGAEMVDMSKAFVWAWDARPWPEFPAKLNVWSDGENHLKGHWLTGRTAVQPLAFVVAEICEAAGLVDYDVRDLHGVVRGFALGDVETGRASIQSLMLSHGFDAVERGGKIIFRNRQLAKDFDVSSDQLVLDDSGDPVFEQTRAPAAEVAGEVRLGYTEAEGEFAARVAKSEFPDSATADATQNDIAIALTDAEAKAITERWLSEARVARDGVRFALPPSRGEVHAGDLAYIQEKNGTKALYRVDRVEDRGGRYVEAVRVEPHVYIPGLGVEEPPVLKPFASVIPVTTQFMDLPLLKGDEVPHAPYIAVTSDPWNGAAAVYSSAQDTDYQLNTSVQNPSVLGITQTDLGAAKSYLWDRRSVTVQISRGALRSETKGAVLNGANVALLGDGSTSNWEVLQFSDVELVAPQTYVLRNLLRGQAGTEHLAEESWPTGSRFILLDGAPQQIVMDRSARGLERHFRVGPGTKPYDDPSFRYFVEEFSGIGLRPYAPVHLKARRVSDDLDVSWIRRTRYDGDSWLSVEVPLAEDTEAYLLRVIKSGTVLREEILNSPAWTYSAAERFADQAGSNFSIEVAQLSQSFGPGVFARIEIND